jgi:hypothetical protein
MLLDELQTLDVGFVPLRGGRLGEMPNTRPSHREEARENWMIYPVRAER